jgi:hypothetical protein
MPPSITLSRQGRRDVFSQSTQVYLIRNLGTPLGCKEKHAFFHNSRQVIMYAIKNNKYFQLLILCLRESDYEAPNLLDHIPHL